jgi:hypothetical protein
MPAGDNGRGAVDISTWLGIAFFVLSIPMGVATNMLTPRFVAYLEQRKLIKSNRTKEQDIATYRSIEALKNGTRDKYPSYIAMAVFSVNCAIGGAACVLLLTLKYGTFDETSLFQSPHTVFLSLISSLFFLLSLLFLVIIVTTERRIERFDEYTAEIRKKWGDDVV